MKCKFLFYGYPFYPFLGNPLTCIYNPVKSAFFSLYSKFLEFVRLWLITKGCFDNLVQMLKAILISLFCLNLILENEIVAANILFRIALTFITSCFYICHFEIGFWNAFLVMFFIALILKIVAPKCHTCFWRNKRHIRKWLHG